MAGSNPIRPGVWITLILLLVVAPVAAVLGGYSDFAMSLRDFLPLHAVMEGIAIVVSILIFVIHWNSLDQQTRGSLVVSCSFLTAGLIYFFHVFGYVGMPPLITENENQKGIFFGIVACGFTAVGLLAASTSNFTGQASSRFRYALLALSFAITGVVFWIGTFHSAWVPATVLPGKGMTSFKKTVDLCWITLFSLAGTQFYLNREKMKNYDIGMAITACVIAVLSEILLMVYRVPSDIFNILAHLYRAAAYWMFYKVVFVSHFQAPHVRLEESERQLQQAVRIRDEFLSIASHELRTPLTPLRARLQLIERSLRGLNSESLLHMIGNAEGELERMTRLVNNLLDVATVRSGQLLSLKLKPCSLADIVRSVIKRAKQDFESSHTPVELDLRSEGKGEWDELRLEQVVTNLVSNALKYAGGSLVRIRLTEEPNGIVALIVQDHGPGVSEAEASRIFGLFQRGSESKTSSGFGLGLGLYIAKSIVETHHGSIAVKSKQGEGTAFIVRLPVLTSIEKSAAS